MSNHSKVECLNNSVTYQWTDNGKIQKVREEHWDKSNVQQKEKIMYYKLDSTLRIILIN